MEAWFSKFIHSFGPEHGVLGAILLFVGGLVNQVLNNRKEIQILGMSTEQKNFMLTLQEATNIRKELRECVERLQRELDAWQKKYYEDLDVWKKKYYEDLAKMKEENLLLLENMKKENIKLTAEAGALRVQITDIKSRWIPKDHQEAYGL